jgi:hypothetical protein
VLIRAGLSQARGVPGKPKMPGLDARTISRGHGRLLESGESLRGLWSNRYPDGGKEQERLLGLR